MSDTLTTFLISGVLIAAILIPYIRMVRKREQQARVRFRNAEIAGLQAAQTVHPHIDLQACIGCGACVAACPEGDVLAVIDGKATLVHGAKCVGHGRCADACPVGGITLMTAFPSRSAELPQLTGQFESSVPNLFIVGELGGIGLIRNAITQATAAVDAIARRQLPGRAEDLDVVVVGAGPAGLAAGLAARERGLRSLVLEQEDIGGSILHYPRQKIVLTSPVDLPLWGRLKFTELSKEKLLAFWQEVLRTTQLQVRLHERVSEVCPADGGFVVTTPCGTYRAAAVVLALGRRGTPRKLGVPGEELPKVMYRLMETESYRNTRIVVVGGGDSAVEAAVGLALQPGNQVILSYRQAEFTRIKQRNREHLDDAVTRGAVTLALGSTVTRITPDTVSLQTAAGERTVPNTYVFIFAGGEPPYELLRKTGVAFQTAVVP